MLESLHSTQVHRTHKATVHQLRDWAAAAVEVLVAMAFALFLVPHTCTHIKTRQPCTLSLVTYRTSYGRPVRGSEREFSGFAFIMVELRGGKVVGKLCTDMVGLWTMLLMVVALLLYGS